jgi:hypothetical protein
MLLFESNTLICLLNKSETRTRPEAFGQSLSELVTPQLRPQVCVANAEPEVSDAGILP